MGRRGGRSRIGRAVLAAAVVVGFGLSGPGIATGAGRHGGHEAAGRAGDRGRAPRLHLRRRPLGRRGRRLGPPAADEPHRRRVGPLHLAGRIDDRLHGLLRRQRRRLHHPGLRRVPDPADLASRPRPRPRLHPGRLGGPARLAERSVHEPLRPVLHRPRLGGHAREAADPQRLTGPPSRPTAGGSPTPRCPLGISSGRTTGAGPRRGSGSTTGPITTSRRSPAPRGAATTTSRCGSARRSTSSPIGTASSTSTATSRARRRSSA